LAMCFNTHCREGSASSGLTIMSNSESRKTLSASSPRGRVLVHQRLSTSTRTVSLTRRWRAFCLRFLYCLLVEAESQGGNGHPGQGGNCRSSRPGLPRPQIASVKFSVNASHRWVSNEVWATATFSHIACQTPQ
jgi:hypothetical protein